MDWLVRNFVENERVVSAGARGGTYIYIYIHVEKERELYEFRCETKSLGSKMVVIYAGRK